MVGTVVEPDALEASVMVMEVAAASGVVDPGGLSGAVGIDGDGGGEGLGVGRWRWRNLVLGKAGVSPVMAIRLEKAFGSSAEVWLGMQMHLIWRRRVSTIGGSGDEAAMSEKLARAVLLFHRGGPWTEADRATCWS